MVTHKAKNKARLEARRRALDKIYYDESNPGSLGGRERLYKAAKEKGIKLKRSDVADYLIKQDAYTLHKPVRKHFSRSKTIVSDIDQQWQADLADMVDVVRDNDRFRYLLTVIDCFSKYAWAIPLKKKDSLTTVEAFKQLFRESKPRVPQRLQTDKGKEFLNTPVQNYLKNKNVHHFVTQNETKAAMVERFNRTLKIRMWRYFTANNTQRYIDVLPSLLSAYNNSVHRTIGMKPVDVTQKDVKRIWHKVYGDTFAGPAIKEKKDAKVGSTIRISKTKNLFDKGYLANFTDELFKITDILKHRHPHTVYKAEDTMGEEIAGTFYDKEFQVIDPKRASESFVIEKILKKDTKQGVPSTFVKWKGHPAKYNSWIPDTELKKLKLRNVSRNKLFLSVCP